MCNLNLQHKTLLTVSLSVSSNSSEKMNLLPHLNFFDSCVKPILLYSSEVWATIVKQNTTIESNYANFSPNKIQIKFAKFL